VVPPVPEADRDTAWHQTYWLSDEAFMAWRYSMYVNKVAAAGKAEYDIPFYCNTWLQEPSHPQPGQFPSGCPEPEVHDIWRFGAPKIDILAPDLYVPLFTETCERFIRNGNPMFIPETSVNASNALIAYLKFNSICFSPFGIEGRGPAQGSNGPPPPDALAQTYAVLDYLAPVILENQGKGTIELLSAADDTNAPPQVLKLGDYTLEIRYGAGGGVGTRGGSRDGGRRGGGGRGGFRGEGGVGGVANVSPARFVINSGPGEYWFVGGPMSVTFTANAPERGSVVMGSFDEALNVNGRWVAGRRLNGDETGNNTRWPGMGTFGIYHYTVFQRP